MNIKNLKKLVTSSPIAATSSVAMSPLNIKVIPSDKLYVSEPNPRWFGNGPNPSNDPAWTNKNWLKSRFHFSFAEYFNPYNSKFGALRVVSNVKDKSSSTPVEINQDVDAFATELDLGKKVKLEIPEGRQAYLLCLEGGLKVNGKSLVRHDACEITGPGGELEIEASSVEKSESGNVAHALVFTMAATPDAGRKDI